MLGSRKEILGVAMLGFLFVGGVIAAIAVLWNEPRWAVFAVAAAIIGAIAGGLSWMVMSSVRPGDPAVVSEMFAALVAPYVGLFVVFLVLGAALVIFRGAYLRHQQRKDDAETAAELARIRKSQ